MNQGVRCEVDINATLSLYDHRFAIGSGYLSTSADFLINLIERDVLSIWVEKRFKDPRLGNCRKDFSCLETRQYGLYVLFGSRAASTLNPPTCGENTNGKRQLDTD